jgi:hypothetical protein
MHSTVPPKYKTPCLWSFALICWELEAWQVREEFLSGFTNERILVVLAAAQFLNANGTEDSSVLPA